MRLISVHHVVLRFMPICAALVAVGAPAAASPIRIVALGDSLTAGWAIPATAAFPARLQQALAARGIAATVTNAGVSGDTAAGGLARLDAAVPAGTDAVIVELGGNDGLFGHDPRATRAALDQILRRLAARHIPVLLCGIKAPPNYDKEYVRTFDAMFPQLAAAHHVLFYPFFLDGVFATAGRSQFDNIHPTAAGVDYIVGRILPKVQQLIAQTRSHPHAPAAAQLPQALPVPASFSPHGAPN